MERKNKRYLKLNRKFKRFCVKHEISPSVQRGTQTAIGNILAPESDTSLECINVTYGKTPCQWIRKEGLTFDAGIILYCHGGGYSSGDLTYCRIIGSKLANITNMNVLTFAYPLSPENPFPSQLISGRKIYKELLTEFGSINSIVAESAGGHLALDIMLKAKKNNLKLPNSMVLLSPWTDMTLSSNSYKTNAENDSSLTPEFLELMRSYFAPHADYTSVLMSPVNSDFTNYPPTLIQVGNNEILLDDSLKLAENMKKFNVDVTLTRFENVVHVFQMYPDKMIPEEKVAMKEIREFILKYS